MRVAKEMEEITKSIEDRVEEEEILRFLYTVYGRLYAYTLQWGRYMRETIENEESAVYQRLASGEVESEEEKRFLILVKISFCLFQRFSERAGEREITVVE